MASRRNNKSVSAVLEALHQLNHATVQEILEWLSSSQRNRDISMTSVYRALNQLVADNQVKPLNFNDGHVRYELNNQQMHHHHFICTGCNSIQMVDICPFETMAAQLKGRFQIQYHNFEVFGRCVDCALPEPV